MKKYLWILIFGASALSASPVWRDVIEPRTLFVPGNHDCPSQKESNREEKNWQINCQLIAILPEKNKIAALVAKLNRKIGPSCQVATIFPEKNKVVPPVAKIDRKRKF
jgi:hypothetical protein